jgi:hypothetical protein
MAVEPVGVACIGMGWWSDVLADAIVRSGKRKIIACYTRSAGKRRQFAAKMRLPCRAQLRRHSISLGRLGGACLGSSNALTAAQVGHPVAGRH